MDRIDQEEKASLLWISHLLQKMKDKLYEPQLTGNTNKELKEVKDLLQITAFFLSRKKSRQWKLNC